MNNSIEKIYKDNNEKFEKLNQEIKENSSKLETINNSIENNKRRVQVLFEFNKIDKFYDSLQFIKSKNINIGSLIINQYDLAQINEGIKRQKGTNIKRLNLVYRAIRDGGSASDYHSKCDGCKNILILVET